MNPIVIQIPGGLLTVEVDPNATTTVSTPIGGTPGGGPLTVQVAPTTTLAALQAIIKGITG